MPKQVEAFTCDICQKILATEAEAALCERRHGDAVVTELVYEPGKIYPESVSVAVTHQNGEVKNLTYYS